MDRRYVIGIDSGGSHTRVVCAGLDGSVLGVGRAAGGSPTHNADAEHNVRSAIRDAIGRAGLRARDAVGLVSGMAGLGNEGDRSWADAFVEVDGLECPRHLVNDAVVAHAGSFAGGAGIMVVAGTGSIILGVNEAGEEINNGRYHHYAGGARHLAFDAMARILIDDDTEQDAELVRDVLEVWGVADKPGLREKARQFESTDYNEVKRFYGRMAPLFTAAAGRSPLATAACRRLVEATCVGIRLLAAHFSSDVVRVALHGGLACSAAFDRETRLALRTPRQPKLEVVDPALSPVAGAALLALQRAGQATDAPVISRLAAV